jgi:SAM-dependent methyltransferase
VHTLQQFIPDWRNLAIHESSPSGLTFEKFSAECQNYIPTQFFPEVSTGTIHQGFRCEDLARQTFADESFDIVITQDVLEHLLDPIASLKEICRTLKPGGLHIFTVPWYSWQDTKIRVRKCGDEIEYLEEPDYHGNPIDEKGSLVVTEWGRDLVDTIYACTGMTTTVMQVHDKYIGAEAKFIEVFLSSKLPQTADELINRWGNE